MHGQSYGSRFAIEFGVYIFIVAARFINRSLQGRKFDALGLRGAIALLRKLRGTLLDVIGELLGLPPVIPQPPVFSPLAFHSIRVGAKHIGVVAPHFSLVGDASQAASSWQYSEQRQFR